MTSDDSDPESSDRLKDDGPAPMRVSEQFINEVFPAELTEIAGRRYRLGRLPLPVKPNERIPSPRGDLGLVGLALSGGGIRSATFATGFVQAMAHAGAFRWVDYMSTVSGGGYIGSCVSLLLKSDQQDPDLPLLPEDAPPSTLLEETVSYLAPEGGIGKVTLVATVIRGLLINLLAMTPYMVLAVSGATMVGSLIYPMRYWVSYEPIFIAAPIPAHPSTTSLPARFWALPLIVPAVIWLGVAIWSGTRPKDARSDRAENIFKVATFVCAAAAIFGIQFWIIHRLEAVRSNHPWLWPSVFSLLFLIPPVAGSIVVFGRSAAATSMAACVLRIFLPAVIYSLFLLGAAWMLFSPPPSWLPESLTPVESITESTWQVLKLTLFFVGTAVAWFWGRININRSSMHPFYRRRLSNAYLFVKDGHRFRPPTAEELHLSSLGSSAGSAPYHLINAALHTSQSPDSKARRMRSDDFIFSKLFVGSQRTGYCPTSELEKADSDLDLATAMAISGAAVSPSMGHITVRSLTFTLTWVNARLGYWLPNPRVIRENYRPSAPNKSSYPRANPYYFVKEMFSAHSEDDDLVFVSDGGHFENSGVLELLRRQCALIIVVDAEFDPSFECEAGHRILALAERPDIRARIEIDFSEFRQCRNLSDGSCKHYVTGSITYANGSTGTLIWTKPSLNGDEDGIVSGYVCKNPRFPHDPTSQQFFDDLQYNCYRRLGRHVASDVCTKVLPELGYHAERRHREFRAERRRRRADASLKSVRPELRTFLQSVIDGTACHAVIPMGDEFLPGLIRKASSIDDVEILDALCQILEIQMPERVTDILPSLVERMCQLQPVANERQLHWIRVLNDHGLRELSEAPTDRLSRKWLARGLRIARTLRSPRHVADALDQIAQYQIGGKLHRDSLSLKRAKANLTRARLQRHRISDAEQCGMCNTLFLEARIAAMEGQPDESDGLARRALGCAVAEYGEDHEETLRILEFLGNRALVRTLDGAEDGASEDFLRRAAAIRERLEEGGSAA